MKLIKLLILKCFLFLLVEIILLLFLYNKLFILVIRHRTPPFPSSANAFRNAPFAL